MIGVVALLLTWLWGRLVHRLTRDAAAVRQLALRLTVPGLLALFAWQLGRLQLLQLNLSGAFGEGYAVALTLALIAAGAWAAWLAAYFVVEVGSARRPLRSTSAPMC